MELKFSRKRTKGTKKREGLNQSTRGEQGQKASCDVTLYKNATKEEAMWSQKKLSSPYIYLGKLILNKND